MKLFLFALPLLLAAPLARAQQTPGRTLYASAAPIFTPGPAPAATAPAHPAATPAIKGFIEVLVHRQLRQVAVQGILMVTPTATGCLITLSGPALDFGKEDNTAAVDTPYGQVLALIQQAQL